MDKKFTYASAFAGVGGMTMGLKPLGGECVIAWEYDPDSKTQYAQQAHKLLHPEIRLEGDIRTTNLEDIPYFDVFCFTPPCQSFSFAGLRGGFKDTRGTLIFEALRIANVKRPKILFMENVKGLISHDKGDTMSTIIHAINEIGYIVDFTILNSKYFEVAQNRERVYLIAIRDDLISHEPWIDTKGSNVLRNAKRRYQEEGAKTFNFNFPIQEEVKSRLSDFLEQDVDGKYYLTDKRTDILVSQMKKRGHMRDSMPQSVNIVSRGAETRTDGLAYCIKGATGGSSKPHLIEHVLDNKIKEFSRYRIRKLTPKECLLLQSIPENYIHMLLNNFSDSMVYKFAGNGLTINVIKSIGEKILKYIK